MRWTVSATKKNIGSARPPPGCFRAACARDWDGTATPGEDGRYFIRSLYFDDYLQSGLLDKIEGTEKREKFRLRYYNLDDGLIRLELKQKIGALTRKRSAPLTREQADAILSGDIWALYSSEEPLLRNFYLKARTRLLRPTVIVDYVREAYVFRDVRITLDSGLHSGQYRTELFDADLFTLPVLPGDRLILEIKYDDALPYTVRQLLRPLSAVRCAISKYELCRATQ